MAALNINTFINLLSGKALNISIKWQRSQELGKKN